MSLSPTAMDPEQFFADVIADVTIEMDDIVTAQTLKRKRELYSQVEKLVGLGYQEASGRPAQNFRTAALALMDGIMTTSKENFLFVVPFGLVPLKFQFAAIVGDARKAGCNCRIAPDSVKLWDTDDRIPTSAPYLVSNIAVSKYERTFPDDRIREIKNRGRLPLTLAEFLMAIVRFPKQIRHRSLIAGSRYGNGATVPCVWFFDKEPMIDFCELRESYAVKKRVEKFAIPHCARRTFIQSR